MSFPLSEYTKIGVGWGLAPDPTGGAYSAPPDPSWFQEEWRGREGRTRGGEEGKKGEMREGGKGGSWGIAPWLLAIDAPEIWCAGRLMSQTQNQFLRRGKYFVAQTHKFSGLCPPPLATYALDKSLYLSTLQTFSLGKVAMTSWQSAQRGVASSV